jgi:CubicO group peptidase (beta-lactamase class C family)
MRKLSLFLIASCLVFSGFSQSRVLAVGAPEKSGMSAERLQRIDKLVQQYIDSGWIAGAIAIVAKDGNIVYHKALGYDDKSKNKMLQKDAIFRIASQTKAITSVG